MINVILYIIINSDNVQKYDDNTMQYFVVITHLNNF